MRAGAGGKVAVTGAAPGRGRLVGLLLGTVLTGTLAGGATGAVLLRDQVSAPATPAVEPTAAPIPVPSRTPLLAPSGADDSPAPTAAGLAAQVDAVLADPAFGGRLAVSVLDTRTGAALLERGAATLLIPASTAKIVTAAAALTAVQPGTRLRTRVLAGTEPGEVVLVGGGDPLLASSEQAARDPDDARLDLLAMQTQFALIGTSITRVVVDDTLYSGPLVAPGWRDTYVPEGQVAPVTALMVDAGRVRPDRRARAADPPLAAGNAFAALLAAPGGPPVPVVRGTAAPGAVELAMVEGEPMSALVERMLVTSDNDLAEALARQVALATGAPASFDGVAQALTAASARLLEQAGVGAGAVRLVDGSGLSRSNVVAPGALTRLLTVVAADPGRLAPVLTGLPVAGFSGTLVDRYRGGPGLPAAGVVRAKTGTLEGVSALAGLVRTADGRLLAFGLSADAVPQGGILRAQAALDRLAAGLASCGCR